MIREVLTEKVTSEQRLQRGAEPLRGKSVLARGSRRCKDPKAGRCLVLMQEPGGKRGGNRTKQENNQRQVTGPVSPRGLGKDRSCVVSPKGTST